MNEIDQVVVLRYDQIRAAALRGCTGPEGLKNTVVFPEQLLLQLRNRVLELLEEIKQQRIRHRWVQFKKAFGSLALNRAQKKLRKRRENLETIL